MNTYSYRFTLLVCVAVVALSGCNFSAGHESLSLEEVWAIPVEAADNPNMSGIDSTDCANFKLESVKKLRGNELMIADMKDYMNTESPDSLTKYKKQLDSLDTQNSRLRNRIHMYNSDGKANWTRFKLSFTREMDALERAITSIADKNTKRAS